MNEHIQAYRNQQIIDSGDVCYPQIKTDHPSKEVELQSHKAYLFAMQLATDALSKQMELFKKYGKTDIADLLENEIQEITTEVARRELKFV